MYKIYNELYVYNLYSTYLIFFYIICIYYTHYKAIWKSDLTEGVSSWCNG